MREMAIKVGVDNLGRITIPAQYRKALNIEVREEINLVFREGGLFIYKEDEKATLKRKINEMVSMANDCSVLNGNEREQLSKILGKLI